jgi:hypothetical protein
MGMPSGGGPSSGGGVPGARGVQSGGRGGAPGPVTPGGGAAVRGARMTIVYKKPPPAGTAARPQPPLTFKEGRVVKALLAGPAGPGGTAARREELRLDAAVGPMPPGKLEATLRSALVKQVASSPARSKPRS